MAIEELTAFIPPPARPIENKGKWKLAEEEIGTTFPADFKQLIASYGTGSFYNSLVIANPLQKWGRKSILSLIEDYRSMYSSLVLFPDQPGLLPWGTDDNGHLYCWWTVGTPDEWQIVQVFHGYEEEIEPVPGPITSFLVRFFSNKYPKMLGGLRFSKKRRSFVQLAR